MGYRSMLLIVFLVFGILFSLLYVSQIVPSAPSVVNVIIPKGSSSPSSEHNNFEPATIKVVIGVNNTVRWINNDVTSSSIRASSMDDPDFFNATEGEASFLDPGETYDFVFNRVGVFDYHSEPHPHKHGTVIVLAK